MRIPWLLSLWSLVRKPKKMEIESRSTIESHVCSCHMHRLGYVCDVCGPVEECEFDHPEMDRELRRKHAEWSKGGPSGEAP
jgi:hypothetical protein